MGTFTDLLIGGLIGFPIALGLTYVLFKAAIYLLAAGAFTVKSSFERHR
jgi:membrane-associated phospholipid phosphatase